MILDSVEIFGLVGGLGIGLNSKISAHQQKLKFLFDPIIKTKTTSLAKQGWDVIARKRNGSKKIMTTLSINARKRSKSESGFGSKIVAILLRQIQPNHR